MKVNKTEKSVSNNDTATPDQPEEKETPSSKNGGQDGLGDTVGKGVDKLFKGLFGK